MKIVKILLALMCISGYASASVTPMWLRDVKISPDGQQVLFCYKGDIYKVSVNGGEAKRLTTQSTYECYPIWSPDGKQIAFASDRHGNFDVFVMSADGGQAKRLTFNSSPELPSTFSVDGKEVYYSASIQDPAESVLFPARSLTEVYAVAATGSRPRQVLATPAEYISFTPDGKKFVYQDRKGGEDEWRKHHVSSITRNIWLYDTKTGQHTNLTARAGEDRNPSFMADGKNVVFLSERGGSMNVYSFDLQSPQQAKQVTSFKTHPVRFLSVASNGTLCYTYDGEIYTQASATAKPKKLAITVTRDDTDIETNLRFTTGATSATVSSDGKQVAFIQRGDVFVTSVEYATTKQITSTPQAERGVCFAPDGRSLVYASERTGTWQLYKATIARKEDPNFANATIIEEKPIAASSGVERSYPQYSPDGKQLAFIQDRQKLMVMDVKSGSIHQVTDGSLWMNTGGGFQYSWSPDGKWFTLTVVGNKHDPYYDIAIVPAKGGEVTNITCSGYASSSPRWVLDGNAIQFTNERYGMRNHASWGTEEDVFLVFMNQDSYDKFNLSEEDYKLVKELEKSNKPAAAKTDKPAAKDDKKPAAKKSAAKKDDAKKDDAKKDDAEKKDAKPAVKDINVELKGIRDRIVRLTPASSNLRDAMLTKDGESLYYIASFEKGTDLLKISLRKGDVKRITKLTGGGGFEMDKAGNLYLLGGGSMRKIDTKTDKIDPITYTATMTLDARAEREYMFNHVCMQEKQRFYDTKMHGVDWKLMTEAYRKFLPHIDNNYDFQELLSELLGELNVSHTGARYSPAATASSDATACLGLLFDMNYKGKGAKVTDVLAGGPFDRAGSKMRKGCVIEKINGEEIDSDMDISVLLNHISRKKTLISFTDPATKKQSEEVILPITKGTQNTLLYDRWVKRMEQMVDSLSHGRLGYVHLESMNDASFRKAYSDMLGRFNQKEGIVIDTRNNGGGRLHEDIEVLVSGEKYLTQVVRGKESCDMPSRRWNKPTIMLQCEANYSNAHGTPWVYSHRNLGKLVGAPVPGTMTSVSWETLQDPTMLFGIPVVGYRQANGKYLENSQLEPDFLVLNKPETVVKGIDDQLKTAVVELLKEIDKK